jgi:hypothetical protein
MYLQLPRLGRVLVGCACIGASSGLRAQAIPSTTPSSPSNSSLASWLQRLEPQRFPDKITEDWFAVPTDAPGITAGLARVLRENKSAAIRGRAAYALGASQREPSIAIAALCAAFADADADVRTQAVMAAKSFGPAAQPKLWESLADFRAIEGAIVYEQPLLVSDLAAVALTGLEGLDPRPLVEDFRAAVARGRWRSVASSAQPGQKSAPEFLGSTEHLRTLLGEIFAKIDPSAAAAFGPYLADSNPDVRRWARAALTDAADTSAVIADLHRVRLTADAIDESTSLEILCHGGSAALPELAAIIGSSTDKRTVDDAQRAINSILAA